jgi:hypothetical protein
MADIFKSLSDKIDAFVDAHPDTLGVVAATAAKTLVDVTQGAYGVATGNGPQVADWFDSRVAESRAILKQAGDDLVDAHPNMLGVIGATALNAIPGTAMVIAQGQVDVARIGQGVKKGTLGGFAQDGLRALSLLSPVSKLAKFGFGKLATAYKDPVSTLGACLPVSLTKALAQTGQMKAYASLNDFLRNHSTFPFATASLNQGRRMIDMVGELSQIGAKFKLTGGAKTMDQLKQLAQANRDGVTTFGVVWNMPGKGQVGHALNAFIGAGGKLKIGDRSGAVVNLLKELERYYPNIGSAGLTGSVLQIPQAAWLKTMTAGGQIGLAVNAVRMVPQNEFKERMKDFHGRQKKK